MLGEERSPWGEVSVLPIARQLGLSPPVTFSTWSVVLLCPCLSVCLPPFPSSFLPSFSLDNLRRVFQVSGNLVIKEINHIRIFLFKKIQ